MEEIPQHVGCIKPCKYWDIYHTIWCRISEPSTVLNLRYGTEQACVTLSVLGLLSSSLCFRFIPSWELINISNTVWHSWFDDLCGICWIFSPPHDSGSWRRKGLGWDSPTQRCHAILVVTSQNPGWGVDPTGMSMVLSKWMSFHPYISRFFTSPK